ncbi:hypothetical protein IGI04_026369, partial [Brassica rapa subsp. trilocularis]
ESFSPPDATLSSFVSAQSGDTDKAKKIREAAIFTISFVACDSPSGNQLLWSIFKALRKFCAYQTLSFSSNAFRALIYIESFELLQPLQPPLPPFPTPPSTLSAFEGPLSPLLVGSSDSRIPGTLTRMESLWASQYSSLMNWGQISLEEEPLATMLPLCFNPTAGFCHRPPLSLKREEKWSAAFWKMVTWSLQNEDGTRDEEDEEKCYLEYPNVEDVDN